VSDDIDSEDSGVDAVNDDFGPLRAPFPYFGGKRDVAAQVWERLGQPKQYIEPFCGSAAMLLSAPKPASLEVAGDFNGFIVNFWRAVQAQPAEVARWADYPVSHIDMGARHIWLMQQRERIGAALHDVDWPGDARVAGWWLWGQCAWIGSGWCEWTSKAREPRATAGVTGNGQIPHISDAGRGVQAAGQIPFVSRTGQGYQNEASVADVASASRAWTSSGAVAHQWLRRLAARLERVRLIHGDWSRCLNHHYGKDATSVFFDPPYENYEGLYRAGKVAQDVAAWCKANPELRIALCGHIGDYDLPGWDVMQWSRKRNTYGGTGTKDAEAIWFSPGCMKPGAAAEVPKRPAKSIASNDSQPSLFDLIKEAS
jgi:DNA adenine methylase